MTISQYSEPMAAPSEVAAPAADDLEERRLGWAGLGVAAVCFLTGLMVAAIVGLIWVAARGLDQAQAKGDLGLSVLSSVGLWVGFLGLPLLWARRRGGPSAILGLRARWVDVPLGLGVGLASTIVTAVVSSAVLSGRQQDDLEVKARETVDRAHGSAAVVLLVVVLCVATPLAEEVFFRGMLFRSLNRVTAAVVAVPLAGLVFGLVHYDAVAAPGIVVAVQLGLLALFGMALCTLAHRTGRLGAGIVAHAAFNAVTVVSLLSQR